MAVQSSDSEQDSSSSSSQQKEEVNNKNTNNKKVDDDSSSSSSSEEDDSSEEEKGVESKSGGSDSRSSSVMKIKKKQGDDNAESSSSSSEDEEEEDSHIANQKVQEKQKSEESENDEGAEEDEEEEEESTRRSNQEIRMKKKNDVAVLVAASINEDEKVSEPEEEEPNAVVVFNPHTDEIAKTQSSLKRPLEEEKEDISSADQGRKKMKVAVTGDSSKSKFDQIFTDDDELEIMKGLVYLNSKHKRFPRYQDLTDLIKPSISFPVTTRQISEKVRRVHKKYRNRNPNANKGGKEMKSTPHELEVFELCEKIWGDQDQSTYNKERGIKKQEVEVEENPKFITFVNDYLGKIMAIGGGGIPHIDLGVFDEGKRAYFAKKLKALMVKELELYSEKAELVTAVVQELKSKQREGGDI